MKTGIFITARLGSTRLKKKHLLPINGQPAIHYLFTRIAVEFKKELNDATAKIVIVTSDEKENREFEFVKDYGVEVFYGSKENIPLRHLQAAVALALDNIVSVDGDDILCSVDGMRQVYGALRQGRSYVKTNNLPFGMNSFGYSREFLAKSLRGNLEMTLETGWGRIFDNDQLHTINLPFEFQSDLLRFTLDYNEDFAFFKAVIEDIGDNIYQAKDKEIVQTVMEKELFKANEAISKEYWNNFYAKMAEEKNEV